MLRRVGNADAGPGRDEPIAAVFRRELDACADVAPALAAELPPGAALERWLYRFRISWA